MASAHVNDIETDEARPSNPYWFRLREILKETNGLQHLKDACLPNGQSSSSPCPKIKGSTQCVSVKNTCRKNVLKSKENQCERSISKGLLYVHSTVTCGIPEAVVYKDKSVSSACANIGLEMMSLCWSSSSRYPTYESLMQVIELNILDKIKTSFPEPDILPVVRSEILPSILKNVQNFVCQRYGQLKPEDTACVEVKRQDNLKKHGGQTEVKVIVCFNVENCEQVNIENAFAIAVNGSVSIMT